MSDITQNHASGVMFETLSSTDLEAFARVLSTLADAARRAAGERQQAERQIEAHSAVRDYRERLRRALAVALQSIRDGMAEQAAIAAAARALDVYPEGVALVLRDDRRRQAKAEREARNIEVMRLAGRGWKNTAIAAKVGLHPQTVSAIIQTMLRKNPARPPATIRSTQEERER